MLRLLLTLVALVSLAGCALPGSPPKESAGLASATSACVSMKVTLSPSPAHRDEIKTIIANVTNVCDSDIALTSSTGCARYGVDVTLRQGGNMWLFQDPGFVKSRSCPAAMGTWRLGPNESVLAVFSWDGRIDGVQASFGTYTVETTLMGNVATDRQDWKVAP